LSGSALTGRISTLDLQAEHVGGAVSTPASVSWPLRRVRDQPQSIPIKEGGDMYIGIGLGTLLIIILLIVLVF
jgi:hypothetical protein